MPIYEYKCTKCGKHHEIIQRHNDKPVTRCPECGGRTKKLISNTSFVLKGTGWYKTDYASPDAKKTSKPAERTEKKDSAKTEAKPDVKTPSSE